MLTIRLLAVLICLLSVSCNALAPAPSTPTVTPEIFMPLPADQRAAEASRESLASELGIAVQAIAVVDVTPVDWPDSCLGLPNPGEICSQVITPGFLVRLREGDAIYEFHTDRAARLIRRIK